ncbi:hypothetical protein GCM10022247_07650 [Allokutzneria multivorans]|uniref:Uncharacterized protein n=1 Tax=Allokutzneria multivorans TaxID=1142134 RepID=A0ABP7R2H2_9PSEU
MPRREHRGEQLGQRGGEARAEWPGEVAPAAQFGGQHGLSGDPGMSTEGVDRWSRGERGAVHPARPGQLGAARAAQVTARCAADAVGGDEQVEQCGDHVPTVPP